MILFRMWDRFAATLEAVWDAYKGWALAGRYRRHVLSMGTLPLARRFARWEDERSRRRVLELRALQAWLHG